MKNGLLRINKIEVKYLCDDRCSLVAEIDDNGVCKELAYTVDKKYEKYLTYERSDAFVVALMYYAMFRSFDIEWVVPCDEKLIYQLQTYFIPIYAKELPFMHNINLHGPLADEQLSSKKGVATGISDGVDSCYTIYKYSNIEKSSFKLTHLIFTNWFITDFSVENQKDFLDKYLSRLPQQAESLGLEFIFVDFKIDTQFSIGFSKDKIRGDIQDVGFFTLKYCSIALALQKLISIYYFSGGMSPSQFSFKEGDMAYHDLFTLPQISAAVQFYSTGMEVTRLQKVEIIADWKYAKDHLQVCMLDNEYNCGHCSKCIRTMAELYVCNKLDLYNSRFPVSNFYYNLTKRLAKVYMQAKKGHIFEKEIIDEIKNRGFNIPVSSYLMYPLYSIFEWLRVNLRESKIARKIYRRFGLDIKLYGRHTYAKHLDEEVEK